MAAPGCSSVSVKWQQFNPTAPPPFQAPQQLPALFSDCHTLVYGFVPHCTQVCRCFFNEDAAAPSGGPQVELQHPPASIHGLLYLAGHPLWKPEW